MICVSKKALRSAVVVGAYHVSGGTSLTPTWIGTGFFIGLKKDDNRMRIFLVTNKHVIRNYHEIVVRFTLLGADEVKESRVPLFDAGGASMFSQHPAAEVDIVVVDMTCVIGATDMNNVACFDLNAECLNLLEMERCGLSEGAFVYALGYPLNLVDPKHNYTVCRMGCVSRIESSYRGLEPMNFLVDAQVFPGNSGGPIVSNVNKNESETSAEQISALIGVVHSYIPYREVLVSSQTGHPRSTSEENSGLSNVHPVDRIVEVIRMEDTRIDLSQIKRGAL